MNNGRPGIWIIDSWREPLDQAKRILETSCTVTYVGPEQPLPPWDPAPDAILLSAELPGGPDGNLWRTLRTNASSTPILVLSSVRSLALAVAWFRAGAADYITNPQSEDEVRGRLEAALQHHMLRSPEPDILAALPTPVPKSQDLSVPSAPQPAQEIPPVAQPPQHADSPAESDETPETVDGLPIATLWDELPCGLVVFDGEGAIMFANQMAADTFGEIDTDGLRARFADGLEDLEALTSNRKPLASNQWPHLQARKSRAARSAVVSVKQPDGRRIWLRIDCLPHLTDGNISRLTMTIINVTGEMLAKSSKK